MKAEDEAEGEREAVVGCVINIPKLAVMPAFVAYAFGVHLCGAGFLYTYSSLAHSYIGILHIAGYIGENRGNCSDAFDLGQPGYIYSKLIYFDRARVQSD